jgi:hypothetical protein
MRYLKRNVLELIPEAMLEDAMYAQCLSMPDQGHRRVSSEITIIYRMTLRH